MTYWEDHYAAGHGSGKGSEGAFAQIKAALVNGALDRHGITSVLDIGSGDGVVAQLLEAGNYLGVDPSPTAVRLAHARNPTKRFQVLDDTIAPREAHLSLDIIHHLVNDDDYRRHMELLFSARRLVVIWVADWKAKRTDAQNIYRRWFSDVPSGWTQRQQIPITGAPVTFYVLSSPSPSGSRSTPPTANQP